MMKKISFLLFVLFSLTTFAQTNDSIIRKAKTLIAQKKYESAYNLLEKADPSNEKPDVVLLKEDILIKYYVTSIMHQMFALKDLNKDEDISDYRGTNGAYNIHVFPADSILLNLLKKYPDNCKLNKGLGDYYFEVLLRYGGNWLKDKETLMQLTQTYFQRAVEGKCADYFAYYALGYIRLIQQKLKESIPYFLQSIKLNDQYPSARYNLAYAYMFSGDLKNALKHAKKSLELYDAPEYKSDAARMTGQIYWEMNDNAHAIKYFETANQIDPGNYYNLRPLLALYLETENPKTMETTKRFFDLDPENPTIYNDLEELFMNNNKLDTLIDFYKSQFQAYHNNMKVQGNLNFYLGRIFLNKDKKKAKIYFSKARQIFEKVFSKKHPVFNVIDKAIKECEK